MVQTLLALVLVTLLAATAASAAEPAPAAASPNEQLAALAREGHEIEKTFYAELKTAGRDMPLVRAANDKHSESGRAWRERVVPLIRKHPAEPAVVDAVLALKEISYLDDEVVAVIREHHFANPKLEQLVQSIGQSSPGEQRRLAEEIPDKHPDRTVRARASLTLGKLDRIYLVDAAQPEPSFGGRLGTPDVLRARARTYLERVAKEYADVKSSEGDALGDLARDELAGLDNVGRLEVGKVAPDVTGEDLDGKPLHLKAAGGRVTVLVFWGTWCGPCMKLVPREVAMAEKYKGRPFALYGVNGGDERAVAKRSAVDKGMTWPSFYSGNERGGIAAAWNVQAWPTVYVIDPAGVIRHKSHGDGLEEAVEKAVTAAEAAAKAS